MFGSLRYRSSKEIKGAALAAVLIVVCVSLWAIGFFSSGGTTHGVVLSAGAMNVARVCGGTLEVASVRLSDERVVYASVGSGGPLRSGAVVTVRKQWSLCSSAGYEVVAHQ